MHLYIWMKTRFASNTGHYTQMVWARTTRLGCGYSFQNSRHILACNYAPAGNMLNAQIYTAVGQACSRCPPGMTKCDDGLCSAAWNVGRGDYTYIFVFNKYVYLAKIRKISLLHALYTTVFSQSFSWAILVWDDVTRLDLVRCVCCPQFIWLVCNVIEIMCREFSRHKIMIWPYDNLTGKNYSCIVDYFKFLCLLEKEINFEKLQSEYRFSFLHQAINEAQNLK